MTRTHFEMSSNLRFTDEPFDRVVAPLAALTFFEDERPLAGQAGFVDWRMNGMISRLILQGKFEGRWEETMIFPSRGRIAADKIILLGLGRSAEMDPARFRGALDRIRDAASSLTAGEVLTHLPVLPGGDAVAPISLLQSWISGAVPASGVRWIFCERPAAYESLLPELKAQGLAPVA